MNEKDSMNESEESMNDREMNEKEESMNEQEWDSLGHLWLSSRQSLDAGALKGIVASHRRGLLAALAGELALLIALAWLTAFVLRDGIEVWEVVWVATLWLFVVIAAGFAWWNRRGTWRTLGSSIAEYVRLTRLRAERQRRSIRFGIVFFLVETLVVAGQLLWFDRLTPAAMALLGAAALLVAAWVFVARRKVARDLAIVKELEQEG